MSAVELDLDLCVEDANRLLADSDAEARVDWAFATLPGPQVLTSSFGAQAAVMLHLVSARRPETPVVLIDTGYLFPETYRFVDELTARLHLNLRVYAPRESAAWQEARYGRQWEQGPAGLEAYLERNKVEPLRRAFTELRVGTWFSGLRRVQSRSRAEIPYLERRDGRYKLSPLADWTDRDVGAYLKRHALPYHPLWERGYVSIGDWHSTRTLEEAGSEEATRFGGIKRECGIHGLPG
ncbi:MAG: phosphoadenylyl-sulfate reductase [Pseudomonadota bacterium]